jgi:hypothetical protein
LSPKSGVRSSANNNFRFQHSTTRPTDTQNIDQACQSWLSKQFSCIERRTMMRTRMEEEEEYLGGGWVL